MFFHGIYFPKRGAWAWLKAIAENRGAVFHVIGECFTNWRGSRATVGDLNFEEPLARPVSGD